jgi:probable HAF family extracellular repeat protein
LAILRGGGFYSATSGVNADGSVIVGGSTSAKGTFLSGIEAFRWTDAHGMKALGFLQNPGGGNSSYAHDVNADGSVVVGHSTSAKGIQAFRWTQDPGGVATGTMVGLGSLPGGAFYSVAHGVNADGSVVVGSSNSQAFRWTQDPVGGASGTMVGLGSLPGGSLFSGAYAVNADGNVVVGHSASARGHEAFRWTQDPGGVATGTMVGLGSLPGGGPFLVMLKA